MSCNPFLMTLDEGWFESAKAIKNVLAVLREALANAIFVRCLMISDHDGRGWQKIRTKRMHSHRQVN
jgi:hypothetical protein